MNKFDENLSEGNYISFKNKSATPFLKGKISIENIDYYSKKVRINSPRSLYAMSKLGVKNQELEYLTFKEYLHKYPQLVGRTKEIQRIKYNNVEEIRKRAIDQIRNLRSEIADEVKPSKKRCFSSKLRSTQNAYFNSSLKSNDLRSSFKDKDIRNFNRIRNNNKAELMIRMQLELKKELIKKLKNEKEKEKNKEKLKKEKEIFEIQKELIKLNALKDEERIRKERAQIISAKKEEEKIIKEKMIKEENNYKELKKRIKQKKKIRDQKDNDRYEFLKNIYSMRESDRLRLSEKQNIANKKREKFIKRIENDRREIIMKKSKILQDKKDKVDQNIKIIEYKQEQKRADYEEKLKEEQEKKIEEEILLKKQKEEEEEEKNNMFEIELEKRLRMVREENEHENNLKTSKNLEKQDDFEEKRNEDLNEEKFSELEKKELKQKENYYRIELQLNQRKEDIMNKIFQKEIDVEKAREEKERLNLKVQEERFQKRLDKDYKIKQIEQSLLNKREEIRDELNEKDKKVEEFMQNKIMKAKQKKMVLDEISKEKEQENEEFDKIWDKKSINKNILNSIKGMAPGNRKIDDIINKLDEVLAKEEGDNYNENENNLV